MALEHAASGIFERGVCRGHCGPGGALRRGAREALWNAAGRRGALGGPSFPIERPPGLPEDRAFQGVSIKASLANPLCN